jgi:hypothetical protein
VEREFSQEAMVKRFLALYAGEPDAPPVGAAHPARSEPQRARAHGARRAAGGGRRRARGQGWTRPLKCLIFNCL